MVIDNRHFILSGSRGGHSRNYHLDDADDVQIRLKRSKIWFKVPGYDMNRKLIVLLAICLLFLMIAELFLLYQNKKYSEDEISELFEPITSMYGIKIVYVINDDFLSSLKNPGMPAGPSKNSIVVPIRHRVLARYAALLKEAMAKYPAGVINKYLNQINFAEEIDENGFKYSGSYDPFRRIIYIVDDGTKSDTDAIHTFHHEFSSLLLARHSFLLNPWTDNHPAGFKYLIQTYDSFDERLKARNSITDYYQIGIVSNYGLTSFENDFNEYSAMIFTYPQRFRQLMEKYPRVLSKFKVWLAFYHKIDPVFTEQYLLGKR